MLHVQSLRSNSLKRWYQISQIRGSPEEHLDELQQSCENWAAKTSRPEQRQVQQQTRMGKHLSSVIQQLVGCLKVLSGTGGSSTSPAENNGGNKIRLKKKYRGVKTVLNLSNKTLSNADWKGLKYCQKPKNHNNIQLKQDDYEFTRKLRPQEYFAAKAIDENDDEPDTHDNHYEYVKCNTDSKSTFVPPSDKDTSLDFYIDSITNEIIQKDKKYKFTPNLSPEELEALKN